MHAYQVAHGYKNLHATHSLRMSPLQYLHLWVSPCLLRPTNAGRPVFLTRFGIGGNFAWEGLLLPAFPCVRLPYSLHVKCRKI